MGVLVRSLVGVAMVFVAMVSFACNRDAADADKTEAESSMTKLRIGLESGVSPERIEPFDLRSFEPFMGDDWIGNAVSYGCYRAGQAPGRKGPSDAEILEDLEIISEHWNLIRVYGADIDTRHILHVIETHELPIKVMLGIWLEPEEGNPERISANVDQVLKGIELANLYPDIVIAVSVGNETQVFWSGHRMKPLALIRYIRAVRSHVAVPVTTADDYNFWNKSESKPVAEEIDFVTTHIHPLWNGKILANAVPWMDSVFSGILMMHPDRMVVLGETGWATDYNPEKTGPGEQGTLIKGKVGLEAQAEFLIQASRWIESNQVVTFLFEAFDEPWKGGGEDSPANEVEKHWGVYNEDRTPKESFVKYLARARKAQD